MFEEQLNTDGVIFSEEYKRGLVYFLRNDILKARNPKEFQILLDKWSFLRRNYVYIKDPNNLRALDPRRVNTHIIPPIQNDATVNVGISGTVTRDAEGYLQNMTFTDNYDQLNRGYRGIHSGESNQPLANNLSDVFDFLKEQGESHLKNRTLDDREIQFIRGVLEDPNNNYSQKKNSNFNKDGRLIITKINFSFEIINIFKYLH